jgi:hypothetical protein
MVGVTNLHSVHSVVLSKLKLTSLLKLASLPAQLRSETTGPSAHVCARVPSNADRKARQTSIVSRDQLNAGAFSCRRQSRDAERTRSQTPQ